MKNKLFASLLLCAALVLPGCQKTTTCSAQAPSSGSYAQVSSAVSSQTDSSVQGQSAAPSSQAEPASSLSGGTVPQGGIVKTESTDSDAFNKKFNSNPIDKAYIAEMKQALSNVAMVNVSEKYTHFWENEVWHAYAALKDALSAKSPDKWKTVNDSQVEWTNGKAAALKKINDDAGAAGGSMARVDAASKVMDFYRDRAAKLYRQLYDYDANYTYAYGG